MQILGIMALVNCNGKRHLSLPGETIVEIILNVSKISMEFQPIIYWRGLVKLVEPKLAAIGQNPLQDGRKYWQNWPNLSPKLVAEIAKKILDEDWWNWWAKIGRNWLPSLAKTYRDIPKKINQKWWNWQPK